MPNFTDTTLFWQFAVAVYETDSMQEICLHFQDSYGLNVNLLLLCVWLDAHHCAINNDDFVTLQDAITETDRELHLLREKRKGFDRKSDAYRCILANELEVEAQQQCQLLLTLTSVSIKRVTQGTRPDATLHAYLKQGGVEDKSVYLSDLKQVLKKNNYFYNLIRSNDKG
ncbi:MAG: TIGR02444 family protein [Aestuariibacter sp.]